MDIASTTESLTHLPIDAVLLIIVALIGAFDGYQSGASRVASLSMALLVAAALLPLTTHAAFLATFFTSLSHGDSIVFAVLLVAGRIEFNVADIPNFITCRRTSPIICN
jgi:hypothetical protein